MHILGNYTDYCVRHRDVKKSVKFSHSVKKGEVFPSRTQKVKFSHPAHNKNGKIFPPCTQKGEVFSPCTQKGEVFPPCTHKGEVFPPCTKTGEVFSWTQKGEVFPCTQKR